jgi:signal transduction histidine kinase
MGEKTTARAWADRLDQLVRETLPALRASRARRGRASGSVLGLAIVKAAARQLDARIELAPGLGGRGVAFIVTWPHTSDTPPLNARRQE